MSEAGVSGYDDLKNGIDGIEPKKFPHPIFDNCIPHIDSFLDNGYTKEEMKMIEETKKILSDDSLRITATTVRVPVYNGHSESINVELKKEFNLDELREVLSGAPGVEVIDDPDNNVYPMPVNANGSDQVFIGRMRRDESLDHGVNLWVVADNIRKGAATNTVQIAEKLMEYWSNNDL